MDESQGELLASSVPFDREITAPVEGHDLKKDARALRVASEAKVWRLRFCFTRSDGKKVEYAHRHRST